MTFLEVMVMVVFQVDKYRCCCVEGEWRERGSDSGSSTTELNNQLFTAYSFRLYTNSYTWMGNWWIGTPISDPCRLFVLGNRYPAHLAGPILLRRYCS